MTGIFMAVYFSCGGAVGVSRHAAILGATVVAQENCKTGLKSLRIKELWMAHEANPVLGGFPKRILMNSSVACFRL